MKNSEETNILIKHTSRSKAGMTEDYSAAKYDKLTLGRSSSCDIAFDPDADNMVSRHHATINALNDGTYRYQIVDEGSTNGVFVNDQQIKGMAILVPGDRVQLGKKGPEFSFDLSPRPDALLSATRVMSIAQKATMVETATSVKTKVAALPSQSASIFDQKMTKMAAAVAAGIFLVVVALSNINWTPALINPNPKGSKIVLPKSDSTTVLSKAPVEMNAAQIASSYKDAVVYINNSWKLEDNQGKQMYHRYTIIKFQDKQYIYPCYVRTQNGGYEPYIEPFNYQGYSKPIGNQGSGTGFVVSEDGFIMTNKHVSAPWNSPYTFKSDAFPGLEVNMNGQLLVNADTTYITIKQHQMGDWIPAEAYVGSLPDGKLYEGKMVYQDVIFANRTGRHAARVSRVSDKHDVALLKVDVATKLTTVTLSDNYNEVVTGTTVSILGYPALTPNGEKIEAGFGPSSTSKVRVVPNLSVNHGIISALHKGSTNFNANSLTRSQIGDAYQLTINSAGNGNSGGPMFDIYGKVIGIYFYGVSDYINTVSFAVPIKYGIELLAL